MSDPHPSEIDGEVIESPDGDPAKRGTIRAAVSLPRANVFGPLDPFAPVEPEDRETRLLVAQRTSEIIRASSVPEGLAALYETERDQRAAREALLDVETWRRP